MNFMNQIDVSVIVINYNTFDLTCHCIKSITEATKIPYEIILVDNASSDINAEDFIRIFPTLCLVKSDENVGFSRGNNLGLSKAKGDYVLLLNSDTILKKDAPSIVKNFLEKNPSVAVATARLEYPNGTIQHNCQRFPSIRYSLFELLRLQKILPSKKHLLFGSFFDHEKIACPDWVWGTFFMFRKELLEKLPGQKLADDFFMYVEDMQWCMEFRKLGFQIAFVPEAKVTHLMGASGGKKNELIERNLKLFMKMYYPAWRRLLIRFLNFLLKISHAS